MLTVVTGAAGFIGRALALRMAETGHPGIIRLVDRVRPLAPSAAFEPVVADILDCTAMALVLHDADVVIHLAALPGGAAEADPAVSRRVNLDASLNLLELAAAKPKQVRLIYASTIAVFGPDLPEIVNDTTAPSPAMTYGAHKLMVEFALGDAVRRGQLSGMALRLPGVVARPQTANGLNSAFMSDIFHAIRMNEPYVVPIGPDATMWMMSALACADALIHAASTALLPTARTALTLPALRVGMAELVGAISANTGGDANLITYRADPKVEAQFGRLPMLATPAADALGFAHDGDVQTLVKRVVAE